MKISKLIIALALAPALALAGSASLLADGAQPWHLTYQIGGANLDSDRNTRDGDIWQSLGFGYFITDNFSLDIEYDEFDGDYEDYNVVVPGATYDQWNLSNWGVMGRYYFGENAWKPFLGLGAGAEKHRSVLDEDTNLSANVALGLHGQLAKHWSVRAQAMWRQDMDGSSIEDRGVFRDFYYSIGLSFDFGGRDEPVAPAPAPAPAAAPAPPPNPDLDGDGVLNEKDKCPNTRPGAVVDLDGCEVEAVIALDNVHFDFDKATLRPEAFAILDKAAGLLKQNERVVVEVAGHTDNVGSDQYNQGLSERRAMAVQAYLVSQGITATRLTARGYGEAQPVASNDTDEGRALNRRVELIILDR